MPQLLAASDLFVSSSHWEGLSNALLEAMAAGLPIIATNVSDSPRVVIKGTGLIVPPQEPAQLAHAINSLLDNPAQMKTLGAAAKTHMLNHYSPTQWIKQLLTLYNSVQKEQKKV